MYHALGATQPVRPMYRTQCRTLSQWSRLMTLLVYADLIQPRSVV